MSSDLRHNILGYVFMPIFLIVFNAAMLANTYLINQSEKVWIPYIATFLAFTILINPVQLFMKERNLAKFRHLVLAGFLLGLLLVVMNMAIYRYMSDFPMNLKQEFAFDNLIHVGLSALFPIMGAILSCWMVAVFKYQSLMRDPEYAG